MSAKMFPPEYIPRKIEDNDPDKRILEVGDEGEKLVYEALRDNLPDDWYVIHDCWRFYMNKKFKDPVNYESDFIILAPHKGIVVLEVKNSRSLRLQNGVWYIGGKALSHHKKSPLNQAYEAVRNLITELEEAFGWRAFGDYICYTGMALLLQQEKKDVNGTAACDEDIYGKLGHLEANELYLYGKEGLGGKVKKQIENIFKFKYAKWFDESRIKEVIKYLLPTCVLRRSPKVYAAIIDKASELITGFLSPLYNNDYGIHVTGVAGSGKTWMLCSEAARLCRLKNKVLILCFNNVLVNHIRSLSSLEEYVKDEMLTVETVPSFFNKILKKPGKWEYDKDDINKIAEYIDGSEEYKHVFVDEAQDVKNLWWKALKRFAKNKKKLYVFSDSNQTLYQKTNRIPFFGVKLNLNRNLRNSLDIAEYCNQLLHEKAEPLKLKCDDVQIFETIDGVDSRAKKVDEIVEQLRQKSVPYGDIVILTPWSDDGNKKEDNAVLRLVKTNTVKIQDYYADPKKNGKKIRWSTIKSFKGLESNYVILTDIPKYDNNSSYFTSDDLYVACTRAKFGLYIIPENSAYEQLNEMLCATKERLKELNYDVSGYDLHSKYSE